MRHSYQLLSHTRFFLLLSYSNIFYSVGYGSSFEIDPQQKKVKFYQLQESPELPSAEVLESHEIAVSLLIQMTNRYCTDSFENLDQIMMDSEQTFQAIETAIEENHPHTLSVFLSRLLQMIYEGQVQLEIHHLNALLEAGARSNHTALSSVITWFIERLDFPTKGPREFLLGSNPTLDPFARSFWIKHWDEGLSIGLFLKTYKETWGFDYPDADALEQSWNTFLMRGHRFVFGLNTFAQFRQVAVQGIKNEMLGFNFSPERFIEFLMLYEKEVYVPSLHQGFVVPAGATLGLRTSRCTPSFRHY